MKPTAVIIGAGVLGLGHAVAAQQAGARVLGVADANLDRAWALAAKCAGAQVFTEAAPLFDACHPTVAHICVPLETRAALVTLALAQGAHVLVEMPLAPTPTEIETLLAQAQAAKRLLVPVLPSPFQAGIQQAEDWLPQIGKLLRLEVRLFSSAALGPGAGRATTFVTAEVLPQPLSLFEHFASSLAAAQWEAQRLRPSHFWARGLLPSGVQLGIEIDLLARPAENTLTLIGTQGTIQVDLLHGYAFGLPGTANGPAPFRLPFERVAGQGGAALFNWLGRLVRGAEATPGLGGLVQAMYAAMAHDQPPPIAPATLLAITQTCDILDQAAP